MAQGRMLNKKVSMDKRVNDISDDTGRLLFTWIIPHLDVEGRFTAEPQLVKSLILPWRDDVTVERVEGYLQEYHDLGLISIEGRLLSVPDYFRLTESERRIGLGRLSEEDWEKLKEKYRFACLRCGKTEPEILLTVDHVIPVSKGGLDNIDNIQPLCYSCNVAKGIKQIDYRPARMVEEAKDG